jgi:hypothetical protein
MPKVKPEEGVAQTVIENEAEEAPKSVNLTSPWGSKVTVPADQADAFKDGGYTGSSSKS